MTHDLLATQRMTTTVGRENILENKLLKYMYLVFLYPAHIMSMEIKPQLPAPAFLPQNPCWVRNMEGP